MDINTFLHRILPTDGEYCVLALQPKQNRRLQKFYDSIGAVEDAAYDLDSKGYDVYFAMATFEEAGSRKVDNIKKIKSFFLDLDCGEGKDFATQKDALLSLRSFTKKLSLPKPVVVNSGRGVHAYWPLKEYVCLDDWLPVADKLKQQCFTHGLLADPAVTADAARVLRVPRTHNYKSDPPAEVTIISDAKYVDFDVFSELLGYDPIAVPTKIEGSNAVMDALMSNTENSFKDIMRKTVEGRGCEQLKLIVTDQENCTEPLWRAGLSIAKFCSDGDKAAQKLSKNHTEYTPELTTEKLNNIKGPYLCSTFDEHSPDICPDCPHFGKIKSPIVLGSRVAEAEDNIVFEPAVSVPNTPITSYVIPTYPRPYFRGANGGVYMRTSNAEGDIDEKVIYHNDLYVVRRLQDIEVGEAIVMRLHLPKDGVREFTIPLTAVTSRDEFRKQMSMQGVAVTKMDELMQYTTTWVNELQASSTADEAHRQFGWVDDEYKSFILGSRDIRPNEIAFNPPSTQTAGLFPAFETKGDLEGWKDTIRFYNKKGMELHQYVVGTAFGSVLMQFQPIHCAALHIHSKDSGLGKTTAMIAGASVWGNPDELILQECDTYATKMNRGEMYHNLPLYIDELTNSHGKELSDMAYQLANGRQRGRMTSGANQERHRGAAWRLLSVTTGNASIVERVSAFKNMPKAEAQRIMEANVRKVHFESKKETDIFSAALKDNYGHAGVEFIQYVMNNLDAVRKICTDMQERVDRLAGLKAENRFWSVGVAMTLSGLLIAKKIGLIDFDLKGIQAWAITQLKANKAAVDDMTVSVEQTLNDYFSEHYNSMIWIKSTQDLRKENNNGLDSLVIPEATPRASKLVARYETDTKLAYLLPKPLKTWCADQQINYAQFVSDLKGKMGAKSRKVRITKGTPMHLPSTNVLVVKCDTDIPEEMVHGTGGT